MAGALAGRVPSRRLELSYFSNLGIDRRLGAGSSWHLQLMSQQKFPPYRFLRPGNWRIHWASQQLFIPLGRQSRSAFVASGVNIRVLRHVRATRDPPIKSAGAHSFR